MGVISGLVEIDRKVKVDENNYKQASYKTSSHTVYLDDTKTLEEFYEEYQNLQTTVENLVTELNSLRNQINGN